VTVTVEVTGVTVGDQGGVEVIPNIFNIIYNPTVEVDARDSDSQLHQHYHNTIRRLGKNPSFCPSHNSSLPVSRSFWPEEPLLLHSSEV
jgi:hypothetical protein